MKLLPPIPEPPQPSERVRVVDTWIRHNGLISRVRQIGNAEPIIESWPENDAPVVFVKSPHSY